MKFKFEANEMHPSFFSQSVVDQFTPKW